MAAENSHKLKLAKIKNVYQHLYFSSPAKFQHFRCNISCRLKIEKFTDVCMTGGMHTPSHTNVCNFLIFNLRFLS